MKNIIWPIVALIIAAGLGLLLRYELAVKPPVVAKIDRFTGDTWIVNSGYWMKVSDVASGTASAAAIPTSSGTAAQKAQ